MDVDPLVLTIIIVAVVVVIAAVLFALWWRKRQHRRELEERYGPDEYQRMVERTGSHQEAEEQLEAREERRKGYQARSLSSGDRETFRARWEQLQMSFVDSPMEAIKDADVLLDAVATAKGYPDDVSRDDRLTDLRVDYPSEVDRYEQVADAPAGDGGPSTEQLRQRFLASRALFDAMVGPAEGAGAAPRSYVEAGPAVPASSAERRSGEEQPRRGEPAEATARREAGGREDRAAETPMRRDESGDEGTSRRRRSRGESDTDRWPAEEEGSAGSGAQPGPMSETRPVDDDRYGRG